MKTELSSFKLFLMIGFISYMGFMSFVEVQAAISPPSISGPVSVCNQEVRVIGQSIGAEVLIILNGDIEHPIGQGTASWPDQIIALTNLPSGKLQAGDKLTAIQSIGANVSDETPDFVEVQKFNSVSLTNINLFSHLYSCGRYLEFGGMAPGSVLKVGQTGERGEAKAVDGIARVALTSPVRLHERLEVHQTACDQIGPVNECPHPDETPLIVPRKMRPPRIASQPYACERAIRIVDVVDGAEVTLFRKNTRPVSAGFFRSDLSLGRISPPFEEGEQLSVTQNMVNCDINESDPSLPAVVLPAEQAPAPVIGPICAGSRRVHIFGVTPGSNVRILQDGAEVGFGGAYASSISMIVPPLPSGAKLVAQEEYCGVWGNKSTPPTSVDPIPAQISPPKIAVEPLLECSTVVPVTGMYPGSLVAVFSRRLGQISATTHVSYMDGAIQVAPALQDGDQVFIKQSACGGSEISSPIVKVQPNLQLDSPHIVKPVEAGQSTIIIENVIPGAIVEIYLNDQFLKAFNIGLPRVVIKIDEHLNVGDRLNVRQIFCNNATDLDPERDVVVIRPKPVEPINLIPNGGKVGSIPVLRWDDPGKGQPQSADDFQLRFSINGNLRPLETVTSSSYTFPMQLDFSAKVIWIVRGHNTTGYGPWSQEASFFVEDYVPRIISFTSTVLNDDRARLEWQVDSDPSSCTVKIKHLYYIDHINNKELSSSGSLEVNRQRSLHDGEYELTVRCGSNKVSEKVIVPKWPGMESPPYRCYYFKLEKYGDPGFCTKDVECGSISEDDAKKHAIATTCANCDKVTVISVDEYYKACN